MKKIWLMVSVLALFSACNKPGAMTNGDTASSYKVSGKIANVNGGRIILDELGERQFVSRDTAEIKPDGTFVFEGKVTEPGLYKLNLGPEQPQVLFVLDNKNIQVEADAQDVMNTLKFNGSTDSDLLHNLNSRMVNFQTEMGELEQRFIAANEAGQQDSIQFLQEKASSAQEQVVASILAFIRQNPNSVVSAYATQTLLQPEQHFAFIDSMNTVFASTLPNSKYTKSLEQIVQERRNTATGSLAPDFTLPNPDGKQVSLSSLRGNYVLIDFWAAWCGPCRKENPNVVRMYDRFKNKGFEIIGVSLDQSKEKWVKAIADDKLPWVHVSDLQGWESSAAQLYNVSAIPHTVLLDKEGNIIARDLRGAQLEKKLESLMQ
jgi:peroxiredoxin